MSNYTTGEMAKLCNVSVRTVQFYDTKGILHPSDLTEGGRRIYNDDDLRKFRLICTLKAIGLSLTSIKRVLESELSGKILTILLDEQVKLLEGEIDERQKQLEMIDIIKENICNEATVSENTIIGVENIMEKKNKDQGKKKLTRIYVGVGFASALGLAFMVWLIVSGIWWGLAVYLSVAILSLMLSAFQLKGFEFICPNCDSVFKPPLRRAFFSTGDLKVRWTTCPECKHTDWCVMQKQELIKDAKSNG